MTERDLEALVEAVVSAHRERDVEGRIAPPPAWFDLSPEAREASFARQWASRVLERALDAAGWSGTVRAVMTRLS